MNKHIRQALINIARNAQDSFMSRYSHLPHSPTNDRQNEMFRTHGSPYSLARACAVAVGSMITVKEADTAIRNYLEEWEAAA